MTRHLSLRGMPDPWTLFIALLIVTLCVLVLYPVVIVMMNSFRDDAGSEGLGGFIQFFTSAYFLRCLRNTFIIGLGAMGLTVVIAVPLAYALARYAIQGSGFFQLAFSAGMLSPPFLGAFCWILMFGHAGVIVQLLRGWGIDMPSIYGPVGIIIVSAVHAYPMVFLIVSAALKRIDPALEEAAATLGRPPAAVFFSVTLPLLLPAILTGAMLVFLGTVADWGTASLIGEGERFPVLATVAFSTFISEMGTEGGLSAVTSTLLLFISMTVAGLLMLVMRRLNVATDQPRQIPPRPLAPVPHRLAQVLIGLLVLANCFPLIMISIFAFLRIDASIITPDFTLDNFTSIGAELSSSLVNSMLLSGAAFLIITALGSLVGYLTVRRRDRMTALADSLIMLPYFIPGTVLGIGFAYSFSGAPFYLTGTAAILVLAYSIRKLPFMVRTTASIVTQIDRSLEEASLVLGVGPGGTFLQIMRPLMAPGISAGALLVWLEVFNELGASVVLYTADTVTVPIMTYRYAFSYQTGMASAAGLVQIAVTLVVFILLRRSGSRQGLMAM
ncbi:iron ABC transporter permease [Rhizobium sp. SSA_523]|uniref:ABC transporter permease n=1 Tax=Rhizobium sp. SSA_523 TaxID=2952477 RepID=UPI0020908FFB|nr:iron ABC transporter permease [Rhizobium sp. SSA_523]MCO5733721.1 iron ABC transporter permease [Rhizobium sp. SSA_523]WKC25003.1 iron ABC transporter permease [Rhizobium sp. SSA_523]